ncbi:MAG: hypothetical protein IH604_12405 [Burkholderiales bacterium]|nr:hypothetical protein [Burkholderiales bacterium]
MTISQWERAERRENPRTHLHLRLALVYPQRAGVPVRPIYHGSTHDICMSGLSMLADENVFYEGEVSVLLALPPAHTWASQKIITATALMSYAIHSSKLNAYKIGLTFQDFKEDGKSLLLAALRGALKNPDDGDAQIGEGRTITGRTSDSQRRGW